MKLQPLVKKALKIFEKRMEKDYINLKPLLIKLEYFMIDDKGRLVFFKNLPKIYLYYCSELDQFDFRDVKQKKFYESYRQVNGKFLFEFIGEL